MTDNVFSILERFEEQGNKLDEMAAHRFGIVGNAVDNLIIHEQVAEAIDTTAYSSSSPATEVVVEDVALSVSEARHNLDVVYGGETGSYGEYTEAA